jgi:hypothetical protein
VDDTYRIGNRTTLNLGVRYDWSRASIRSYPVLDAQGNPTNQTSRQIPEVFSWNSVSPRFGLIYRLQKDGKSLVKLHAGRYYGGVITSEFDNISPSVTPRYLFSGFYDRAGNPLDLDLVSDNTNLAVDSSFKDPHTDQYIVGFEQELTTNFGLQINYVHKRGDDFGAWRDVRGQYQPMSYVDSVGKDATGQTFQVFRLLTPASQRLFQLTNPDGMFLRYHGVSIQGQKRMANRWQATGSIVLSKSTGRLGSSRATPTASQNGTAGTFGQNPNDFVNTEGRLIGDRPVVAKLQLLYDGPWGVTIATNFTRQDGRLWSRQIQVSGLGFPSRPTINMEANTGDRRVPAWNLIDVRLEKDFSINSSTRAGVFLDVLNLTNSDANQGIGSRLGNNASFGLATSFLPPRRAMIGAKLKF